MSGYRPLTRAISEFVGLWKLGYGVVSLVPVATEDFEDA